MKILPKLRIWRLWRQKRRSDDPCTCFRKVPSLQEERCLTNCLELLLLAPSAQLHRFARGLLSTGKRKSRGHGGTDVNDPKRLSRALTPCTSGAKGSVE